MEVGKHCHLRRIAMKDAFSCEDVNGRTQATHIGCTQSCVVSATVLALVLPRVFNIDFVFMDNKVVVTGDTTIAEFVESVLEGATFNSASGADCCDGGCAPRPVTSAAAISVVDNIAYAPWEFETLP